MPSAKAKMSSLLHRFTSFGPGTPSDPNALTPRPDGFHTAPKAPQLFPPTDPNIDGDACLHDCATCSIHYPRKFRIDEDDALYGQIKGWSRHVLVATGKTDWVRDVEDEKGSVMEALGKHASAVEGGRLMVSASNISVPEWSSGEGEGKNGIYGKDRPTRVVLLPAFQILEGVTPRSTPDVITSIINPAPTNLQPLSSTTTPPTSLALPEGVSLTSCPHKTLILLCSQATRDARCGQSAPLLYKELARHLRPLGLFRNHDDDRPGGVGIYFISHVGGHKYSANMMVYRRSTSSGSGNGNGNGHGGNKEPGEKEQGGKGEGEAAQCIWLARVRPEDCENIVRYTVLEGKVVKPERQLRGGFDRERGIVSW
ncbi:hypothetical protein B0A50_00093 [Salinomyces thailandicus]|uniref:Sucrase/ferredoxin domain-containing protein n=1 Tax=Salinomyces thailandicus TaxID=706561 RepID=A0A4U0UF03_9PEZI|nr:hypothetical protein B0A50_00093 [Salinomyces thailandica]